MMWYVDIEDKITLWPSDMEDILDPYNLEDTICTLNNILNNVLVF